MGVCLVGSFARALGGVVVGVGRVWLLRRCLGPTMSEAVSDRVGLSQKDTNRTRNLLFKRNSSLDCQTGPHCEGNSTRFIWSLGAENVCCDR